MAETQVQPLILFKSLKGFPSIDDDGKIETILFLEAARETVEQIGEKNKQSQLNLGKIKSTQR